MTEIWKPIVGHPGYEASSLGRIRSLDRYIVVLKKGRVLSPGKSSNGYPSVILSGRVSKTVHAIITETFLGPRPRGYEVRHVDGNKANATIANLAYGTPKENGQDRVRHGTSKWRKK